MMKKLLIVMLLAFLLTLVGCKGDEDRIRFINVGEKINTIHIQHDDGNQYQIEIKDKNGHNVWEDVGDYVDDLIVTDTDLPTYIERLPDKINKFSENSPSFILHINPKDPLQAGTVGRNRVHTTMIQ